MANKNNTVQATLSTEAGRFAKCISALREVEIAAASGSDLSAIFQVLLKNIEGFLPYPDSATVALLLDAGSGQFEPLAFRNVPKGAEEQCKRAWAASAAEVLKGTAT